MNESVVIAKEMDDSMYLETLSQMIAPYIYEDEEFCGVMGEWDKILIDHPSIAAILDWGEERDLGKEDSKALHRIFELQDRMHELEKKALIIVVQNQMMGLFLQYENRK